MECDPEKTSFVYVCSDPFEGVMGGDIHITGREYMTLSPEQQGDFILSCSIVLFIVSTFLVGMIAQPENIDAITRIPVAAVLMLKLIIGVSRTNPFIIMLFLIEYHCPYKCHNK